MAEFPHGMPNWVELSTDDGESAASFYTALFGWEVAAAEPAELTGGYRMFLQDGKPVAGLMVDASLPTLWGTYFSVDDANIAAAQIGEAGGTTLVGPLDVMNLGRMGFFADASGALFGVWQAGSFSGFDPDQGTVGIRCWSELVTADPEEAKQFYARVFGWSPAPYSPADDYTIWICGEDAAGGMTTIGSELAVPGDSSRWEAIFSVSDTDACVARAAVLGATVTVPPTDIPPGRYAAITDPLGGSFQVLKPLPLEA
jgi:predicted enzyme related to lactoylglutathione lyase